MEKYCLCCGKILNTKTEYFWHKECIKNFFGTSVFPNISLIDDVIENIAIDQIKNHKSVTGVQKKLSIGLEREIANRRFTFTNLNPCFIIKTPDSSIPYITEMEQLIMLLANEVGFNTVKHGLIKSKNNGYFYISKRIDRIDGKKLPMEDFCQLSNQLTEYKYQGSYEKCMKNIISRYSINKSIDLINFFKIIYFSYIVGNTDMHLKNFSLIDDGKGYHLASFYDLVSSYVLVDQIEMALSIDGKRTKITKNNFIKFGLHAGLTRDLILRLMNNINEKIESSYLELITQSLLNENLKKKLIDCISSRLKQLAI